MPATRLRLLARGTRHFAIAMLIGVGLGAIPLLIAGFHVPHVIRWEVVEAPATDEALLEWLESQPQALEPEIERDGTTITIRYRDEPFASRYLSPPAGSLGYRIDRARLSRSLFSGILESLGSSLLLLTLVSGQVGFLAVGWTRFRDRPAGPAEPHGPLGRTILVGLGTGITLLILNLAISAIAQQLTSADLSGVAQFTGLKDYGHGAQLLIAAAIVLVAPVTEELFFRGVLFAEIADEGYPLMGALVSSAFFGVVHGHPLAILVAFVLGLVLALVYRQTRSLLPVMIAHGVNNLAGIALLLW